MLIKYGTKRSWSAIEGAITDPNEKNEKESISNISQYANLVVVETGDKNKNYCMFKFLLLFYSPASFMFISTLYMLIVFVLCFIYEVIVKISP